MRDGTARVSVLAIRLGVVTLSASETPVNECETQSFTPSGIPGKASEPVMLPWSRAVNYDVPKRWRKKFREVNGAKKRYKRPKHVRSAISY
jgi:hypothetical protein